MSSSFGDLFRVTTFGESHGGGVGAVVDGCPAGLALTAADIQPMLDRRRPGQSRITTHREEADQVLILSGTEDGKTLGTPILLLVRNTDHKPSDYGNMRQIPRPSHADYTYQMKYGIRATSGGGRASARETIGRVAAGAIAEKWLQERFGLEIVAWVSNVGGIAAPPVETATLNRETVDRHITRCPHPETAARMQALIEEVQAAQDSTGGIVSCLCRRVPVGLGEPVFDKLEARLAQAMLSIPASKGFDLGSGFAGVALRGSVHNDRFFWKDGRLRTLTNNSGGVQGGISNGEEILFRVAFKPVATIGLAQETADFEGNSVTLAAKGRHDPCVVPRAVPIVESMTALTLMDMVLQQEARQPR